MMYGLKLNGSMQPWYGGAVFLAPPFIRRLSADVSFVESFFLSIIHLLCRLFSSSGRIGAIFWAILVEVLGFVHHDKVFWSVVLRKHRG